MRKVLLALTAATALISSPAFAERACLQFGNIYNWKPLNNRTLIVEDDWHKKFKLKLIGVCNNLNFHERLAFRSRGALALSCLSPGDEVITREFGTGFEKCAITSIEAYTPEMEAADKAAAQAAKEQRQGY
jgi:uncharacterized protein DUF6491